MHACSLSSERVDLGKNKGGKKIELLALKPIPSELKISKKGKTKKGKQRKRKMGERKKRREM